MEEVRCSHFENIFEAYLRWSKVYKTDKKSEFKTEWNSNLRKDTHHDHPKIRYHKHRIHPFLISVVNLMV
jgi:hypothetical protein